MTQIFGIHSIEGLPYTTDLKFQSVDYLSTLTKNPISSIYMSSEPAGAKIFIDGIEQVGFKTPSMITDVPSGHHNFKLSSPGYIDIESSIPLESGKTYNIFLTMQSLQPSPNNNSGIILLLALGLGLLLFNSLRNRY